MQTWKCPTEINWFNLWLVWVRGLFINSLGYPQWLVKNPLQASSCQIVLAHSRCMPVLGCLPPVRTNGIAVRQCRSSKTVCTCFVPALAVKGMYTWFSSCHVTRSYAMLTRPNKAETAVCGCNCLVDRLCTCMRSWPDHGCVLWLPFTKIN